MFEAWDRPCGLDSPAAYAHVVLVRTCISRRRRRSFFERPTGIVQEGETVDDQIEVRMVLRDALVGLRRGDRAVLVLRYLLDRSVEQVAYDLAISPAALRTGAKLRSSGCGWYWAIDNFSSCCPNEGRTTR
jgi:DNA-directed RNA polymerase specialized sigma24 family protein